MAESIYEWIRPDPVAPEKPALYHAKASPNAPLAGSTIKIVKKQHAYLGAELGKTVSPTNYLKAHEKSGHHDATFLPHAATGLTSKMPPVPRRDERPMRHGPSGRDFVSENALAAMMAEPRYKNKEEVNWLASETFGRVPAYLDRIKKERESERDYVLGLLDQQQMEAESASGVHTREMTDEERTELIDALKRKWDVVNSKYQVISHRKISTSNSTMGELRWKESCETQMAQLEADIKKLSVKSALYVVE